MWPANSALLTVNSFFFCCLITQKLQNDRATVKTSNINLYRALGNKTVYIVIYGIYDYSSHKDNVSFMYLHTDWRHEHFDWLFSSD